MLNGLYSRLTIRAERAINKQIHVRVLHLRRFTCQAREKRKSGFPSTTCAVFGADKLRGRGHGSDRDVKQSLYSTTTSRKSSFSHEEPRGSRRGPKYGEEETICSPQVEYQVVDHGLSLNSSQRNRLQYVEGDKCAQQQALERPETQQEGWELTVGIEIHAELPTTCKLFSAAATSLADAPNTHVSVFDAGFPGAQPSFQKESLVPALRAALAFGCEIQSRSSFDRKHYFHWDQPNGYQITQYYHPLAKNGQVVLYEQDGIDAVDLPSVAIGVKQIQLEQDTAKTTLQPPNVHLLDFNRASHPLIEIISLPQMHTPKTAAAYVRKVQSVLKAVGASTTGMEMGGLRADVNVSVRRIDSERHGLSNAQGQTYAGISGLGQRTEIKNLSSFKAVEDAIVAEMNRQIDLLESGETVVGETRGWTIGETETRRLRGKEGEVDYRYMPDPDVQPVLISDNLIQYLKDTMPMLPDDIHRQLISDPRYQISPKDAKTLIALDGGDRLDYFFDVVDRICPRLTGDSQTGPLSKVGKTTANWILHELSHLSDTSDELSAVQEELPIQSRMTWPPVDPATLADILTALLKDEISLPAAKGLLKQFSTGGQYSATAPGDRPSVIEVIATEGLRLQQVGEEQYVVLAQELIRDNPTMAVEARKAEAKLQGKANDNKSAKKNGKLMWFVGQMVQKGDKSKIQPAVAEKVVRNLLFANE